MFKGYLIWDLGSYQTDVGHYFIKIKMLSFVGKPKIVTMWDIWFSSARSLQASGAMYCLLALSCRLMCLSAWERQIISFNVFQVPAEEEENEESLAHADHSKNKAEA